MVGLSIRLSEEQRDRLRAAAAVAEMTMTDYILDRCLGHHPVQAPPVRDMLGEKIKRTERATKPEAQKQCRHGLWSCRLCQTGRWTGE